MRGRFPVHYAPEATFTGCALLFLAAMTLVTESQPSACSGCVEATTLASAPLIYFHRHHRSLEATWKYLLICSVGIALALLGNFFVAVAAGATRLEFATCWPGLGNSRAVAQAAFPVDPRRLRHEDGPCAAAHVVAGRAQRSAVGDLGAVVGRAPELRVPRHPAHAPDRRAAGLGASARNCSLVRTHLDGSRAVFIVGQTDYKRMLAYSSVEHMGILALGVGLGGAACSARCCTR